MAVCLFSCLYICSWTCPSVYLSRQQSVTYFHTSVSLSVSLPVILCHFNCLVVFFSFSYSDCPYVSLCVYRLPAHGFICLFGHLFICLSVCPSAISQLFRLKIYNHINFCSLLNFKQPTLQVHNICLWDYPAFNNFWLWVTY